MTSGRLIRIKVNGETHELEVDYRITLVDFLRDKVGLTGTHIGCDTGQCGCCVVMLDGQAVKSCLMFAVQADGSNITTIEGLSDGSKLHPIQEAFWNNFALQCGFCTPGFIISAYQLLLENPDPTEADIRRGISGNICRCTGYVNIVKAVKEAAQTMKKGKRRR